MPAQLTSLFGRLKAAIGHFTIAQRTLVIIGVAGVVLGAIALASYLSKPTMSPLFADLAPADASAIVDQLNADGVAYTLTGGGGTILVANDQLYAERLKVAAAGLPAATDGAGYSLLDKMGMTASEFQQTTTYRRAMEGELAKTIGAMNGVQAASVKLAMPTQSVFVSTTADPTASVFLKTSRGTTLEAEQIQAIVHLVSAGVTGMKPADVSVVDADGHVLSAVGGSAVGGMSDQRTGNYDARVGASVQAMLDRVVGVGKAVVTVNAELNLDNSDVTSETFTAPANVPALSSATTTETYTGTGAGSSGVLGPNNIAVPGGAAGTGTYSKGSENLNPAVNKVTQKTTTTPGSVRRQSVSVVVDQGAGAALNMTDLTTMVTAAAGIDATRGDTVAVSRMTFDTTSAATAKAALAADATATKALAQATLIRQGAIAAGILLLLVVMFIIAKRKSRKDRRQALDLGELAMVNDTPLLPFGGLEALGLPAAPSSPVIDEDAMRRAEIGALAQEQPAEVADLLRGWLVGGAKR